jgi:hypothetical protein
MAKKLRKGKKREKRAGFVSAHCFSFLRLCRMLNVATVFHYHTLRLAIRAHYQHPFLAHIPTLKI